MTARLRRKPRGADHRFLWSAGYEPWADEGPWLTSGDENLASTRNTGFSLFFACVTGFSLSARALCRFFNAAHLRSSPLPVPEPIK